MSLPCRSQMNCSPLGRVDQTEPQLGVFLKFPFVRGYNTKEHRHFIFFLGGGLPLKRTNPTFSEASSGTTKHEPHARMSSVLAKDDVHVLSAHELFAGHQIPKDPRTGPAGAGGTFLGFLSHLLRCPWKFSMAKNGIRFLLVESRGEPKTPKKATTLLPKGPRNKRLTLWGLH